jgi:hypothetical protein
MTTSSNNPYASFEKDTDETDEEFSLKESDNDNFSRIYGGEDDDDDIVSLFTAKTEGDDSTFNFCTEAEGDTDTDDYTLKASEDVMEQEHCQRLLQQQQCQMTDPGNDDDIVSLFTARTEGDHNSTYNFCTRAEAQDSENEHDNDDYTLKASEDVMEQEHCQSLQQQQCQITEPDTGDDIDLEDNAHSSANNAAALHAYVTEHKNDPGRPTMYTESDYGSIGISQVFEPIALAPSLSLVGSETNDEHNHGDGDGDGDGLTVMLDGIDQDIDDIHTLAGGSTIGGSTLSSIDNATWRGGPEQLKVLLADQDGTFITKEDEPLPIPSNFVATHRRQQSATQEMMDDPDPVMDDLVAAAANGDARTRANMRALVKRANQEQDNEGQNSHPQSHQRSFKKKTKWFGKSSSVLSASEDAIRDENHIIQTKDTVPSASSQNNDVARKGKATSTQTPPAETRSAPLASSFCQDLWRIVLESPCWVRLVLMASFVLMVASFSFLAIVYLHKHTQKDQLQPHSRPQSPANSPLSQTYPNTARSSLRGSTAYTGLDNDPF